MIAVQEDATENIGKSNSAQRALMSVGAGRDEVSALGMHRRSSFAMIGRKGAKPGSVPQVQGSQPGLLCRALLVFAVEAWPREGWIHCVVILSLR